MLYNYTEIIGSELPIYLSKTEDLMTAEDVTLNKNDKRYSLVGYLLVDEKNHLYKPVYKELGGS